MKRVMSLLLVLIMIMSSFYCFTTVNAINAKTSAQIKAWLDNEVAAACQRGSGECVPFCNYYLTDFWGVPKVSVSVAKNWYCPEGFSEIELYGDANNFKMGDIVVEDWGDGVGHVCIYYGIENGRHCVVDQNYHGIRYPNKHVWERPLSCNTRCFRPTVSNYFTLDVNGKLDGSDSGSLGSYGTFDVYINGSRVANDVNDYCNSAVTAGSSYVITDIKPKSGYAFDGVSSGARTGTLNGNANVRLKFHTIDAAKYVKNNPKPNNTFYFNGHTYYYYSSPVTWYEANQICNYLGGHLVTITSSSESSVVFVATGGSAAWIGATDRDKEGTWKWVTGESFSYSEWAKGEPNNNTASEEGTENYASTTENYSWNDACGCKKYPFVCELDYISAESVYGVENQISVFVGSYRELEARVDPWESTDVIKWTSSNSKVASVVQTSTSGGRSFAQVMGVSEGTAVITATAGKKSATCTVTVRNNPSIVTTSLPKAQQYIQYSTTLKAEGTGTLTWSISSGSLPKGLTLNANTGVLSGKPKVSGNFKFTVKVKGGNGSYTKVFSLEIAKNDNPISIKNHKVTFSDSTHAKLHFDINNLTDEAVNARIVVAEFSPKGEALSCSEQKDIKVVSGNTSVDLSLKLSDPENSIAVFTVRKDNGAVLCDAVRINYTSDWVLSNLIIYPSNDKIVNRKWVYTLTEKTTSYESKLSGWTLTGSEWIDTGVSGTYYYADYPGGFDSGHTLYNKYNHSAYKASSGKENGKEWKKEVTSTAVKNYIYWHWTCNMYSTSNGNYNVLINDQYCWEDGREYYNFRAFESTADYGHIDPNGRNGGGAFYAWFGEPLDGSWWWFRFPVYKQTWKKSVKQYNFTKISVLETNTGAPSGDGISNVKMYVKCRRDIDLYTTKDGNNELYNKAKANLVYKIDYHLGGGTNSAKNPEYYDSLVDTALHTPTRKGYTFKGWYSDSARTQRIYKIAKGTKGTYSVYAKWEKKTYTVTYHLSGGKNSSKNPATYTYSSSTDVALHTPTLKGYAFKGWYTDSAKTNKVTKIAAGTTGDVELWAKWARKTYTISYHLSGGTNSSKNPSTYTYSSSKDVALHTPTRKGYTFKGWYTDSARTKRIYKIAGGTTGDLTLYAKWEKK